MKKGKRTFVIIFAILIIILMVLSITNIIDESKGMILTLALSVVFTFIGAITAYKSDVKIIFGLLIAITTIGIVLLVYNIYTLVTKEEEDKILFYIETKEDMSGKKKIFTYNDTDYYTYNLSEVNVHLLDENRVFTLEKAISNNKITLDEILSYAIASEDTDGYQIYYDGGVSDYEDDEYSVIKCGSSNAVIFAPYLYTYTSNICKDED